MDRYEINIARRYGRPGGWASCTHYAKMTLVTLDEPTAVKMLEETRERYPVPDWRVSMTHWTETGHAKPAWDAK